MNQEATIAKLTLDCQRHFEQFNDTLVGNTNEGKYPLFSTELEDELGRFRLWANNIGAASTGRRSLDYRLRDEKYLFQNVRSLLKDLKNTLSDGIHHY